jgi:hypothetical protein
MSTSPSFLALDFDLEWLILYLLFAAMAAALLYGVTSILIIFSVRTG